MGVRNTATRIDCSVIFAYLATARRRLRLARYESCWSTESLLLVVAENLERIESNPQDGSEPRVCGAGTPPGVAAAAAEW